MTNGKKVFNVLGIIMAWLLSIALVILLVVSPIVLSALSLLDAKTITNAFASSITTPGTKDTQPSAEGVKITRLSNVTDETAPNSNTTGAIDISQIGDLESLLGDDIDEEVLNEILSSDVAKEIIEVYTGDIANAFLDDGSQGQFDGEKLKDIVNNNIDEVVDILQKAVPELADMDKDDLKSEIQKAVDENANEIVQALPKPEEIKQQITESSPELEIVLKIIAQKNTIKLVIVGVLVLLSALIFLCRLCGFRGLRWLATDLFVAGGIGLLVCVALTLSSSLLTDMVATEPMLSGLIGALLSAFTTGLWIRIGVMILSAVALLVAYILIKRTRAKKAAPQEA